MVEVPQMAGIPGPWQIVIIALVVLLLFGGRKIPELMKGLGRGVKEFKDATNAQDSNGSESEKIDEKSK